MVKKFKKAVRAIKMGLETREYMKNLNQSGYFLRNLDVHDRAEAIILEGQIYMSEKYPDIWTGSVEHEKARFSALMRKNNELEVGLV